MLSAYKFLKPVTLILFAALAAPSAVVAGGHSQEVIEVSAGLEKNRRQVVAENMNLSPEQEADFWRVYDEYRQDAVEIEKNRFELLREFRQNYAALSSDDAEIMVLTYLDLEEETNSLRQDYVREFNSVISARQTLRFFQIDVRVDSIIRGEISANNPLVE